MSQAQESNVGLVTFLFYTHEDGPSMSKHVGLILVIRYVMMHNLFYFML